MSSDLRDIATEVDDATSPDARARGRWENSAIKMLQIAIEGDAEAMYEILAPNEEK